MKTPYGPGIRQPGEPALPPVHASDAEPGPDLLPGHPLVRRRQPLIPLGVHTTQELPLRLRITPGVFRALCMKAGIAGVWASRELRHTFVSVMSESCVAVAEIARLTGHSSSRTTGTIYRHELRPVITTGADVMDKIFI